MTTFVNLPDRVKNIGHLVFFFETRDYQDFLKTLVEFKKRNKELRITAISPLWDLTQGTVWHFGGGYCVNCEE